MRVYGVADPPHGFVQFCLKTPDECRSGKTNDNRIEATPAVVAELDEVLPVAGLHTWRADRHSGHC